MSDESRKKFSDLNMTKDELNRFSEAMKKEEFRKLLVEYAEELSDPVNRAQYEKEIAQLEEERGMNVTFIHPDKGFCIKTTQNGDKKCFINICKNDNIQKPTSKSQTTKKNGKISSGLMWEIPHTCSPAREDFDNSKLKCVVYDVVFHPDSYRMGETNERFKKLLKDSAMDTIEKSYNVQLDRVNEKVLKNMDFKGKPTACVIKKKAENFTENSSDDPIKPLIDQIKEHSLDKDLDERLKNKTVTKQNDSNQSKNNKQAPTTQKPRIEEIETHTVPKYSIIHRGQTDMSDHAYQLDSTVISSTRPKEIAISIELPLLKSSQNVELDVYETTIELNHEEPNYKLKIKLPYPVGESEARAKFDKSKRCLNITLPVIPFVGKLGDTTEYVYPLSTDSSVSNSSNSIADSSTIATSPVKEPLVEKKSAKLLLPSKCSISETKKFVSFKFYVKNYVKDTIRIKIESESTLNITCDSCSLSGCYIQYYAAHIQLNSSKIIEDLISNNQREISDFNANEASLNFNDSEFFELKLKKSSETESKASKSASFSLDSTKKDAQIIEIEQDTTEEKVENSAISENKINNMSRKDYIINFKDIISNPIEPEVDDELDEDDDDCESVKNINSENLLEKNEDDESDYDKIDFEKEYLESNFYSHNEETNEENDEADRDEKKSTDRSSSASGFTNESSTDGSSLNSSSSNLKGILKKPRSFSESESSLSSFAKINMPVKKESPLSESYDSGDQHSNSDENLSNSKKSVHFNNQVVRNVFKSNSTIQGMKKPNSNKNRKKNQRKRTISDPSYDSNYSDLRDSNSQGNSNLRSRSISESSEDGSLSQSGNSLDSIAENKKQEQTKKSKNKKKNKKKNKNSTVAKTDSTSSISANYSENAESSEDRTFNVETMMQWKNQGLLPDDESMNHGTQCQFKFKNKIIADLDD